MTTACKPCTYAKRVAKNRYEFGFIEFNFDDRTQDRVLPQGKLVTFEEADNWMAAQRQPGPVMNPA